MKKIGQPISSRACSSGSLNLPIYNISKIKFGVKEFDDGFIPVSQPSFSSVEPETVLLWWTPTSYAWDDKVYKVGDKYYWESQYKYLTLKGESVDQVPFWFLLGLRRNVPSDIMNLDLIPLKGLISTKISIPKQIYKKYQKIIVGAGKPFALVRKYDEES